MVPMVAAGPTREDLSEALPSMERKERFGEADHWRNYGRDLADVLDETGFAVELYDPAEHVSAEDRTRHGLRAGELLFIGVKRG